LDYYWDRAPREHQKKVFVRQIDIAKELQMPIIIHDRDAHGDILEIVKKEKAGLNGGVFHAYSGSLEMAREVIKEGFYISVGGVITFQNAKKLAEVVREIPLKYILIETDSPYLTPHPFRGKRNDPVKVKYVAEKIAEIKGITLEEVARETMKNGRELFRIEN
ncbi:MAG: TatD family deoxyribonuclease, partial [Clostridia bacterium]|nr:TatD family deoxyribonuclease [Clostridia bacterium]